MIKLNDLTPLEILTLTIYGEARGEPIEGQIAVACVIRNRVNKRNKSYFEICTQPKQFSCWNEDDPNRAVLVEIAEKWTMNSPVDNIHLRQCQWIASGIVNNSILDNTNKSLNYLTHSLFVGNRPSWADYPTSDPIQHGKQVFFNV